jgi:hypothetical protein
MNQWVLLLDSPGPTRSGIVPDAAAMAVIAQIVQTQVNVDYAAECGGAPCSVRYSDGTDIQPSEKRYIFMATLPNAPGDSAYHIPGAAYCAVSTCQDLYGPNGLSVDASHEILEDEGNPGCNMAVDDGQGQEHERERCDAVESQTYPITHPTVGSVHVSNFLLDAWQIPGGAGPYSFMAKNNLPGAVDPKGAFQTAVSPTQGNYQLLFPSSASSMKPVFGKGAPMTLPMTLSMALVGTPRRPAKTAHWSSRATRILSARNARNSHSTP